MIWITIGTIFVALMIFILIIAIFSDKTVVITSSSAKNLNKATVCYYLPESILKIKSAVKIAVVYESTENPIINSCEIIEQSFITTTEMIADTNHLLTLNYNPSIYMADEIKYAVNNKGLLETINVITEDRLSYIISKLSDAPKEMLNNFTEKTNSQANRFIKTKSIIRILEFSSEFIVKASSISDAEKIVPWTINIVNEFGAEPPKNITANFSIISEKKNPSSISLLDQPVKSKSKKYFSIEGLLTRPLINKEITIKRKNNEENLALPIIISIADTSKIINIPIRRSPFIKTINNITILDGLVLSNEINHPSIAEGFISIPINIAKALISIPAQLIQFKFDNTKRLNELEKSNLDLQKSIRESQNFSRQNDEEFNKIKKDNQINELNNQTELQKLKLDLQKKDINVLSEKLDKIKKDGKIVFD